MSVSSPNCYNTLLRVHDKKAIDNDFNHSSDEVSVSMNLEAGYHPVRLYMISSKGRDLKFFLKLKSDSGVFQDVAVFFKGN